MSRRNGGGNFLAEIVGAVFGLILFVPIAVIGLATAGVIEVLKVTPQKRLLELQPPPIWGRVPKPLICPGCNQHNEFDAKVCLRCGLKLRVGVEQHKVIKAVKKITAFFITLITENPETTIGIVITIVVVVVVLVSLFFCGWMFIDPVFWGLG